MPSSNFATVDWEVPTKVPILNVGDITPAVMCKYEDACIGFLEARQGLNELHHFLQAVPGN
jgi:hypothetical protein